MKVSLIRLFVDLRLYIITTNTTTTITTTTTTTTFTIIIIVVVIIMTAYQTCFSSIRAGDLLILNLLALPTTFQKCKFTSLGLYFEII
jgi:hypothetical protein